MEVQLFHNMVLNTILPRQKYPFFIQQNVFVKKNALFAREKTTNFFQNIVRDQREEIVPPSGQVFF